MSRDEETHSVAMSIAEGKKEFFDAMDNFLLSLQEDMVESLKNFIQKAFKVNESTLSLFPMWGIVSVRDLILAGNQSIDTIAAGMPRNRLQHKEAVMAITITYILGKYFYCHIQENTHGVQAFGSELIEHSVDSIIFPNSTSEVDKFITSIDIDKLMRYIRVLKRDNHIALLAEALANKKVDPIMGSQVNIKKDDSSLSTSSTQSSRLILQTKGKGRNSVPNHEDRGGGKQTGRGRNRGKTIKTSNGKPPPTKTDTKVQSNIKKGNEIKSTPKNYNRQLTPGTSGQPIRLPSPRNLNNNFEYTGENLNHNFVPPPEAFTSFAARQAINAQSTIGLNPVEAKVILETILNPSKNNSPNPEQKASGEDESCIFKIII